MKAMTKEEITALCKENGWDGIINEDGTITLKNEKEADIWQCAKNAGFTVAGNTISAEGIYRRTKPEETDAKEFLLECARESVVPGSLSGSRAENKYRAFGSCFLFCGRRGAACFFIFSAFLQEKHPAQSMFYMY